MVARFLSKRLYVSLDSLFVNFGPQFFDSPETLSLNEASIEQEKEDLQENLAFKFGRRTLFFFERNQRVLSILE